jgi:c-di-AMP phosphodiesterase-like protein
MPRFIFQYCYGSHMVLSMCFSLILVSIVSMYNWIFGILGLLIYVIIGFIQYRASQNFQQNFDRYALSLIDQIEQVSKTTLNKIPVGIFIYGQDKQIEWHNPYLSEITGRKTMIGLPLGAVFPELQEINDIKQLPSVIQKGERTFTLHHHVDQRLCFLQDVTELIQLKQKYEDQRAVLGFILLDNLDDVEQGLSDQETAVLVSNVWSEISHWAEKYQITLKRLDTDKMFFVVEHHALKELIKSKFDILDKIREMTKQYKIPVTLSIGASTVGATMIERSRSAHAALEIALARGGDQAAVRNEEKIIFFGGKTSAIEKRTRVRARVISQTLGNMVRDSKRVIVMGHVQPDMDAIGAALGVVKFALIHDSEGYIVLDEINPSIERLVKLIDDHEYLNDHIISSDQALQWIDDEDTLLVLVDTHKPSLAIEPRLLRKSRQTVVIDHHRRGEDFVDDAILVYLEPYASSTSELVTELLQYKEDQLEMDSLEATALLAGIVVDTKNFVVRAGSRTFEAASFLRRHGADLTLMQSLLKEDFHQFIARADLIKKTELYKGSIAIAVGQEQQFYDQMLIAQAADTLLNMQGIVASFVICRRNEEVVSVSARSHGELNVQVIMEEMGGGGHLTNAACQIKNKSVNKVKEQLVSVLNEIEWDGGAVK